MYMIHRGIFQSIRLFTITIIRCAEGIRMKKKHLSVDDKYSLDDIVIHGDNQSRLEDDPPINTKRLIRTIFSYICFLGKLGW